VRDTEKFISNAPPRADKVTQEYTSTVRYILQIIEICRNKIARAERADGTTDSLELYGRLGYRFLSRNRAARKLLGRICGPAE